MTRWDVTIEDFKEAVAENIKNQFRRTIDQATKEQLFQAVAYAVKDIVIDEWIETHKTYDAQDPKTVYYLSMEFLMGRALGNDMMNLRISQVVKTAMDELGIDLNAIEDMEPDPGLGNGGLGRLAACFLDSLAALEYPAYGCGIRYHYGIFEQKIIDGYQVEKPDEWLRRGNPFEVKRDEYSVEVKFFGDVRMEKGPKGRDRYVQENYQSVKGVPYDIPIVGYANYTVNTLRLWDAKAMKTFDLESFDRGEYQKAVEEENLAKTIVEVLYPNDNHMKGKELRLKQQYFFVSATVQQVVAKFKKKHGDMHLLPKKVAFHINDTHPSLAIPELMRILLDEEGMTWDEAWDITTKTCAYTNHTILSEALECWPIPLFKGLLPRIYMIVEEINRRFCLFLEKEYMVNKPHLERMTILSGNYIRMAYLAIVGSYSVNGVARLHTNILKEEVLRDFYHIFPDKFNNKTNGITQRRFLLLSNPELASFLTKRIGEEWVTDLSKIRGLKAYVEKEEDQKEFMAIKHRNKERLAEYIQEHQGITVDPYSIFDVQVKRLHEYKRQLMNILHIMYLYNQLKENPDFDMVPRTFIFGAKAAPGYRKAKLIIKLINSVADVINHDESIHNKLKVVFIENYCVSNAQIIFSAADVSEQISTASKEASGTGNMKLMLNGAATIGTMDGANIEIVEEVGRENAFIFGMSSSQVIQLTKEGTYKPIEIYEQNKDIKKIVDQLIDGTFMPSDPELFREIYESLLHGEGGRADPYFILKDFWSYKKAHDEIDLIYRDSSRWAKIAMLNTACSGKFSADRTIEQYATEIWHLDKTPVRIDHE